MQRIAAWILIALTILSLPAVARQQAGGTTSDDALGSDLTQAAADGISPAEQGEPRRRPRGTRGRPPEAEAAQPQEKTKEEKKDEPDTWLAITGADVHTVTDGVYEKTTILVKNGVIHEIGNAVKIPEDAETIDAAGMRVYPGIVSLTSRGILGRPPVEDTTDPFSLNMVLALSAGVTTVVSSNATAKLTYGSIDNMTLTENPWVPLTYTSRNPGGKRNLRKDLDRVREYMKDKRLYDRAKSRGDEDAEEPDGKFLTGKFGNYKALLTGQKRAHFRRTNSAGDMLAICRLCRDYGISAIIEGGTEGWTIASELGRANVSMILTPRNRQDEDTQTNRRSGSSIENAAILYDHGVSLAIMAPSGSISLGGQTGRDLLNVPMSAAFAVRGGLPEDAALEAITIEPARLLGVDNQIGSIEEGKDADLIICDGDLLHYLTMVQWTIVNGKVVYDKEKEPLLRHIRPRDGEPEEVDNQWPRRWIEEQLKGTGPGVPEQD